MTVRSVGESERIRTPRKKSNTPALSSARFSAGGVLPALQHQRGEHAFVETAKTLFQQCVLEAV